MKLSTDNLPADDRAVAPRPCVTSAAAWDELEEYFVGIDRQIAAFKGHAARVVTRTRSTNLLLWEQWEGQMQAADTPSARRRERRLMEQRNRRRTYWTRLRDNVRRRAARAEFDCPIPAPGPVSRAGLWLLNLLCCDAAMICVMVLLAAYMAITHLF